MANPGNSMRQFEALPTFPWLLVSERPPLGSAQPRWKPLEKHLFFLAAGFLGSGFPRRPASCDFVLYGAENGNETVKLMHERAKIRGVF